MTAYEAARSRAALAPRPERAVIAVEGRDPVAMLQGLVSNDVRPVPSGHAVYATMLTPKGKMLADLRAVPGPEDAILLDVPATATDALLAHFGRFVPPRMARARRHEGRVAGVYGPEAPALLARAAGLPAAPDPAVDALAATPSGVLVLGSAYAGSPGFDLLGVPAEVEAILTGLRAPDVPDLDAPTLEALRVESGSPRWGAELTEERIPLEAGLERAISQTKGCYTGQEVIVRILHRGHVNWLLKGLRASRLLDPGAELVAADAPKVVARVTSAAASPRLGPIALAYARRELAPGTPLFVAGESADRAPEPVATLTELPFSE